MRHLQGTRWWLVCPCLVLIVVGCVLASMKRSYTPEESRKIFLYLRQKQASEQEVIDLFDHHSKVITNPNTSQPERRYYFCTHLLWEANVNEWWALYDEEGKLKYFVGASQTLKGSGLWKYRFDSILNLFAK